MNAELEQRVQQLEDDVRRLRYELWGERRRPERPLHFYGDRDGYPPRDVEYTDMRAEYHGDAHPPRDRLLRGDVWRTSGGEVVIWNGERWVSPREFTAASRPPV